jgi:hypothetical protein
VHATRVTLFFTAGLLSLGLAVEARAITALSRTFSRDVAWTNSPIVITATLTNSEAASLRGFCFTEQLPAGLAVTPVSVLLNGVALTNCTFATGLTGDVYPGCTPWRCILEIPPLFSAANSVPSQGAVQITYRISSASAGLFRLRQFTWSASLTDHPTPAFGSSKLRDEHTVCFVPSTVPLPAQGAIWTLWWQHTNGALARWVMVGTNLVACSSMNPPRTAPEWRLRAVGDVNASGEQQLFFEHADGRLVTWFLDDTNVLRSTFLNPRQVQPSWTLITLGDIDGDGQKDFIWRNSDGHVATWFMDDINCSGSASLNPSSVDPAWTLALSGNLTGERQGQLVWQHKDGRLALWSMRGTSLARSSPLNPPRVDPEWKLAGTVDLEGIGTDALLWRHEAGALAFWVMNGTNLVRSGHFGPGVDPSWQIVGSR